MLRWWLPGFTLLVLGLAVAHWSLHTSEPLWIDELHTGWCVVGPWSELLERTALGNQAPLYFAACKAWASLLGPSSWVLRLPSYVSALLLVGSGTIMVGWLTRSPLAALVTGVGLATQTDLAFYAVEARPYAVLAAVLAVHLASGMAARSDWLVTTTEVPNRRLARWVWCLSGAVALHLHYTAGMMLLVETLMLAGVGAARWRPRGDWIALLIDLACVGLLSLPLVPGLRAVAGRREAWGSFVSSDWEQAMPFVWLGGLTLGITALAWGLERMIQWLGRCLPSRADTPDDLESKSQTGEMGGARRAWGLAVSVYGVAVVLGSWLLAATLTWMGIAPVLLMRYLFATLPWVFIGTGLGLGSLRNSWLRLLAACAVMVGCASQADVQAWWQTGIWPAHRNEPWQQTVAWIDRHVQPDSPILLFANLIEDPLLLVDRSPERLAYGRFPLQSLYVPQGPATRIAPCPSYPVARLPVTPLEELVAQGEGLFVIRDRPDEPVVVWEAVEQLRGFLAGQEGRFEVDLQSWGALHVVSVKRLERANRESETTGP